MSPRDRVIILRQKCRFVTPHVGEHPTKPDQKYCVTFAFAPSLPDATIKNVDSSYLPLVAKKNADTPALTRDKDSNEKF